MTVRWLVRGRVQGVGFRYFVIRRAQAVGLAGWARNLPDGGVEVVARGTDDQLAALENALRVGPPRAEVTGVERQEVPDDPTLPKSFDIR
ncbi:MAG: acylphosphatase [Gemmatimonadetes bacterium]|nr:acylphosphatase [Gemmatimonadota bacterium]